MTEKILLNPKKTGTKQLMNRDVQAIQWVCEQGAMTVEQLWRAVWWSEHSKSPKYAYDRLQLLCQDGYLFRLRNIVSSSTYLCSTRLGRNVAEIHSKMALPAEGVVPAELAHSHELTELKLHTLRAGHLRGWKTDRLLKIDPDFPRHRFLHHIPDAIWLTPRGSRVAIEYERTRKGPRRLRQKIERFNRELQRPDRYMDQVLWIAEPGPYFDLEKLMPSNRFHTLSTKQEFIDELTGVSRVQI